MDNVKTNFFNEEKRKERKEKLRNFKLGRGGILALGLTGLTIASIWTFKKIFNVQDLSDNFDGDVDINFTFLPKMPTTGLQLPKIDDILDDIEDTTDVIEDYVQSERFADDDLDVDYSQDFIDDLFDEIEEALDISSDEIQEKVDTIIDILERPKIVIQRNEIDVIEDIDDIGFTID